MITPVRSATSRVPKNDSGSMRSRSAMPMRLRALSSNTMLYVALYSAIWVAYIAAKTAMIAARNRPICGSGYAGSAR